jgi:hypothetical protein
MVASGSGSHTPTSTHTYTHTHTHTHTHTQTEREREREREREEEMQRAQKLTRSTSTCKHVGTHPVTPFLTAPLAGAGPGVPARRAPGGGDDCGVAYVSLPGEGSATQNIPHIGSCAGYASQLGHALFDRWCISRIDTIMLYDRPRCEDLLFS